jgi:EAL domain-containing protein (putative c-di-GMP-specific phosphodiesterase class I)
LAQLSKWRRAGGPVTDMAVGVNLSTTTLLRPDLANLVFAGLDTYAVAPDQLILEITEHEAIPETASVEVALRSLHSAGVALWLDDFGIGYTSLHYLDRFPISVLKIDKSVVDAGTGEHPSPLLGSLVAMGQSAGVTVLAEGIETGPQAQRLTDLGFDLGQGYFMARPMPGDMVADWLQSVARSGDVIGANVVGADRSVAGVGQSTGWLQR